jgi:hypothetical protein
MDIIMIMEENGWDFLEDETLSSIGYFFTKSIDEKDWKNLVEFHKPHHILNALHNYRYVYFAEMYASKENSFFYATSNIKVNFRRYRAKNPYVTEIGNIFASGRNMEVCTTNFLKYYKNLNYNRG